MPIGRTSKGGSARRNAAKGLRFGNEKLFVVFADGREMGVPLSFYPTLLRASQAQRDNWELIGPGKGFHWKDLDLDLSVDGLVQGLKESIPRPPRRAALRSVRSQRAGACRT